MTTKIISKSEAKAQQASQSSQDNQSQDKTASIPVIEGLKPSLEMLYSLERSEARKLTQTVKVQAYTDEFEEAIANLKQGSVSPDFFSSLKKGFAPIAGTVMPMLLPSLFCHADEPLDFANLAQYDRETIKDRYNLLIDLEREDCEEFKALTTYLIPVAEVAA